MKKLVLLSLLSLTTCYVTIGCSSSDESNGGYSNNGSGSGSGNGSGSGSGSGGGTPCGTYNGKRLYKGPEGGCYYINSNGNKTYVDKSLCKC